MISILKEISKIRKGAALVVDYKNSNRYRVVAIEPNGSKTAYYFTVPIYNNRTRKAVDMKFYAKGGTIYSTGSNANITITDKVTMENSEGSCIISLSNRATRISDDKIVCGNEQLYPTTNGIAIKSSCEEEKSYTFYLETSKPFLEVRANDKYFALMSEKFRPFVVISCIGTSDVNGNIISPAKISYQKITDRKYIITITPCFKLGNLVLIETNLYEPKLFQDTTVESKNPKTNNAFGSIGFIGTTNDFGEQWLYSRPDFSKIDDLGNRTINKATWYIPALGNSNLNVCITQVLSRFCSFGSNWNNKKSGHKRSNISEIIPGYHKIDLTNMITRDHRLLTTSEGFILKNAIKNSGFSAISTGDSFYSPQILEITFT